MKNIFKPAAVISAFLTFFLIQGASADVPTISGDFYEAHSAESSAYGVLGIVAIVCVVAAIALVMLGAVRRDVLSKKTLTKKIEKK
jgi:hypothetical protein